MLAGEQFGHVVPVAVDQLLEGEHDPRALLRVRGRPAGLHRLGRRHRPLEQRRIAQRHLSLHFAGGRVPHLMRASARRRAAAPGDEVVDGAH